MVHFHQIYWDHSNLYDSIHANPKLKLHYQDLLVVFLILHQEGLQVQLFLLLLLIAIAQVDFFIFFSYCAFVHVFNSIACTVSIMFFNTPFIFSYIMTSFTNIFTIFLRFLEGMLISNGALSGWIYFR